MTTLLLGIFLAALLFAALLWAGYRAYITRGRAQMLNLATIVLPILLMALIPSQSSLGGRAIGAMLAISALAATYYDESWSRLLPLTLAALGAFAAIGGPFA